MIRDMYIVKSDGEPLYGRCFEEDAIVNLKALPLFVRNSVALFHSRSSTSSERVYILEHEESIWSYVFFHNFVLVCLSNKDESLIDLKNVVLAMGRSISQRFGEMIVTWSGSMSEIVDIDDLIDQYIFFNFEPPTKNLLKKIEKQIHLALLKPEIAFAGVFDAKGKMIEGNLPLTHLFRIEVEISQGVIKPVMDIVPTSVNSGDYKLQMLRVNSLTVVVASQANESTLRAVAVVAEIAHTLYDFI
ncbi:MAG: hypothetical protein E4H14_04680 [Candidatus Thorarchaeota archaeon]|nr:MAG: hypothetical protein E4H14_04680 [Candidatus Thorarchaeota archaeon]